MDSINGYDPTLPIDLNGSTSPDLLSEVTLGPHLEYPDGSVPMIVKASTGRVSPVRARTMKEYDAQISELKKENFSLKLRIYFMEERMQQKFGDGEDVFKTNIELKVEVERLKKEITDKQELLRKASDAIETLSGNQQVELEQVRAQIEGETTAARKKLEEQLESSKKELEASQSSLQRASHQLMDMENEIEKLKMEIRHVQHSKDVQMQGMKDELTAKQKELDDMREEMNEKDGKMEGLTKEIKNLQEKLQRQDKEIQRKDRDIEDEIDDQKDKLSDLKDKIKEMEQSLTNKDNMIGKLEDLLKKKEVEKKNLLKDLKDAKAEIAKQKDLGLVRDTAIKGLHDEVRDRDREIDTLNEKLKDKEEALRKLSDDLHDTSIKKQNELDKQHDDITFLEGKVSSMAVQLKDRELEIEKLLQTLGKKEGELEGFKELLNKAEGALRQSEDAVQDLQAQLRKEKKEASTDWKTEELNFKVEELQKQIQHKDKMIQQLTESLNDKDRQMKQCMEIFKPDEGSWNHELIQELKDKLKKADGDLKKLIERSQKEKDAVELEKERAIQDKNELINRLRRDLDKLQMDLEGLRRENNSLMSRNNDLENLIQSARNKNASTSAQTSPVHNGSPVCTPEHSPVRTSNQSPVHKSDRWSPRSNTVSPDFSIPLNRQSLSDMTAPMLRRFIRQLQQQLQGLELENMDLRKRLDSEGGGDLNKQPTGISHSDDSVKLLRKEIDNLNAQLSEQHKLIKILLEKLGLDNNSNVDYKNLPSMKDLQNELIRLRIQLTSSEELIDCLKRQVALATKSDSLLVEINPQLTVKLASEIQNLQEELKTRTQMKSVMDSSTQTVTPHITFSSGLGKISFKGQDKDMMKSSKIPRLQKPGGHQPVLGDHSHVDNPEVLKHLLNEARARIEQLEDKLSGTEGTVRLQTHKMKHYKSLLESHGLMAKSPGISRSNSESNIPVAAQGHVSRIPVRQRSTSHDDLVTLRKEDDLPNSLLQEKEAIRKPDGWDDSAMTRSPLQHLQEQVNNLQHHLQETRTNNSRLAQKMSEKQVPDQAIALLQSQLNDSRQQVSEMERKLKSLEGSSLQQVLDSQKGEIGDLKMKLSDTRNSLLHMNDRLDEVYSFLSDLARNEDNLSESRTSSVKQKVQQSQAVLRSLSSLLGTEDSPDLTVQGTSPRESVPELKRLRQELRSKDTVIADLTALVKTRDAQIENLVHDVALARQRLSLLQESGKGSSTSGGSAADGNVDDANYRCHRDSLSPGSEEINGKPGTVAADRTTDSVERERRRFESGSSVSRMSAPNISCVDIKDTGDSSTLRSKPTLHSQTSSNSHSSPDSSFHRKGYGNLQHFPLSERYDSDDRLYGNHRFADMDVFDQTITPSVCDDAKNVSLTSGRKLFNSTHNGDTSKMNQSHVRSFMETSVQQAELDNLRSRCQAVEELNKTLKDEISMFENLCRSEGIQTSPIKIDNRRSSAGDDFELIRQNLAEFRALRKKLEKQIDYNEKLYGYIDRERDTDNVTTNVFMYSEQQSHIQDLQQTIDRLEKSLREKEHIITEKITIIKEKEQVITEYRSMVSEKEASLKDVTEEKFEQQKTLVLQQKRIAQRDETVNRLQQKLDVQESNLHQQEQKFKEQLEIIRRQDEEIETQKSTLEEKMSEIEKLRDILQTREAEMETQREMIKHKSDHIETLMKTLRTKDDKISDMEEKTKLWMQKAEYLDKQRGQKDINVKKLVERVERMEQSVVTKEKMLSQQENTIDDLKRREEKALKRNKRLAEEIKLLEEQNRMNKDLNKTLRLELSVHEKLEDKENQDVSPEGKDGLLKQLLSELKHLRVALERSINTNEELRKKLESFLLHQTSPRATINIKQMKDSSPSRSGDTDVPDGQPSPQQKPTRDHNTSHYKKSHYDKSHHEKSHYDKSHQDKSHYDKTCHIKSHHDKPHLDKSHHDTSHLSIEQERRADMDHSHHRSIMSHDTSCLSDSASVVSSEPGRPLAEFGFSTFPLSKQDLPRLDHSASSIGLTHHSDLCSRMGHSDMNLSYHIDDSPSMLADVTSLKVDSDLRSLFAIGKLDDYEKLKKENGECAVILKGIKARIQDRLKIFKTMAPMESMEYSTLRELSLSTENLQICLNEAVSLLECFWTSSLPDPDSVTAKKRAEYEIVHRELTSLQTKYDMLTQCVRDSKERLHSTNQQRQQTEDLIYKQLKKTKKVFTQAHTNFRQQAKKSGISTPDIQGHLHKLDSGRNRLDSTGSDPFSEYSGTS